MLGRPVRSRRVRAAFSPGAPMSAITDSPPSVRRFARRLQLPGTPSWTELSDASAAAAARPRPGSGPVLVASTGAQDTLPALRLAAALAARDRRSVRVVAAVDGPPVFARGFDAHALPPGVPDLDAPRRELRALVASVGARPDAWPADVLVGVPAPLLAAAAAEHGASLLVCGLGGRRLRDRRSGGESVLRIIRHAGVPVLTVPAAMSRLPHTAVVALDFGEASIAAARATLSLLGDAGTAYLVHVRPAAPPGVGAVLPTGPGYPAELDGWFDRLLAELAPPPDLVVRPVVLRGAPVTQVLDFATRVRADVVAAGAQGPTPTRRCWVGTVATALLRGARGAALVAPAALPAPGAGHPPTFPSGAPIDG